MWFLTFTGMLLRSITSASSQRAYIRLDSATTGTKRIEPTHGGISAMTLVTQATNPSHPVRIRVANSSDANQLA